MIVKRAAGTRASRSVSTARGGQPRARWVGFGLLRVLSLQSVAGLIAGYTRGGDRMLATLGSGNAPARFWVAAVALLLGNLVVPGLILVLSKIAAILVGELVTMPPASALSYAWARPAAPAQVPVSVELPAQMDRVASQSTQTTIAAPASDRQCKYCGQAGLSAIEVARHGRARKRSGACP